MVHSSSTRRGSTFSTATFFDTGWLTQTCDCFGSAVTVHGVLHIMVEDNKTTKLWLSQVVKDVETK